MSAKATAKSTAGGVCPRCGTRLSSTATRCIVCGTEIGSHASTGIRRRRTEITISIPLALMISIPLALILLAIFSLISAGLAFAAARLTGVGSSAASEETATPTPSVTRTVQVTATFTPAATWTALPPLEHGISSGDTCIGLAAIIPALTATC